jgi:hypothetical protein
LDQYPLEPLNRIVMMGSWAYHQQEHVVTIAMEGKRMGRLHQEVGRAHHGENTYSLCPQKDASLSFCTQIKEEVKLRFCPCNRTSSVEKIVHSRNLSD